MLIPLENSDKLARVSLGDFARVIEKRWFLHPQGYVQSARPFRVMLHHFVMGTKPKEVEWDHIDRDKLNNTRSNLRQCSRSENLCNRPIQPNNHSGFKGIIRTIQGRWQARIAVNRKRVYLGNFDTPEDAARVYDAKAREIHGEFAVTNFKEN